MQIMHIVGNYPSVVQIDMYLEKDLMQSLEIYRESSHEGNKTIKEDFDAVQHLVNDPLIYFINLKLYHIYLVYLKFVSLQIFYPSPCR